MFKRLSKVFIFTLISLCIFAFLSPTKVDAAKFVTGDYTLERAEILHDDLYVSGGIVVINGIVDGDMYIAADNVSITGTISDDVYIASETVSVSGNVYGDLVAFGATVDIPGSIGKSSYLIGSVISSTGSVVNDLIIIGANIETGGYVDEDVIALGGEVTVKSTIAEDLIIFGANPSFSDASISGKTYDERGNFSVQDVDFVFNPGVSWSSIASTTFLTGVSMYLVGALLIYVMPVKTLNIVKKSISTGEEFIKSFATGFVILFIVSIPTLLLLTLTIIGIPLAYVLFTLLFFLIFFARLWVEIGIGKLILSSMGKKRSSFYLALLVGRCISILINLIPIIGTLYTVVITLVGIGAFFRMKFDLMSPSKKKTVKKTTKKVTKVKKTSKK